MTRPRRHQQMPITAAPDIRAASKVNSTGPIQGADRVDPETDPHDTDPATDPPPEKSTTAEAGPPAGSLDEDDPSGESGRAADGPPAASANSPATGPQWISGTAGATVPVTHGGRTYKAKQGDTLYAVASQHG